MLTIASTSTRQTAASDAGVLPSLRSGRMRQLSRELLFLLAPLRENQEFKTDPLRGGLTAALGNDE